MKQALSGWVATAAFLVLPIGNTAASAADAAGDGIGVVMETALGAIEIEVYPDAAPVTAANFLAYVDRGLFENAAFYRTVSPENDNNPYPIDVIQGGVNIRYDTDFEPLLPPIAHETTTLTGLRHSDGAVSMARFAPGTAHGEFFISIGENAVLDHGGPRNPDKLGFAVFGQVTNGMDVVRRIHALPAGAAAADPYVEGQLLTEPVAIRSITRKSATR